MSKEKKERLKQLRAKQRLHELRMKAAGQQPEEEEESERVVAGIAGAAQGATFGFADELAAAAETAYDVVTEVGKEAMYKGISGVDMNLAEITEQYDNNLKETRKAFDHLQEKHGNYYMGGDIAGSIISGLATGGSTALFGAGLKGVGKAIGIATVQGAAHGLGRGEARTLNGVLEEAGMGAGYDIAGTIIGGVGGKLVGRAMTSMGAESFLNYLGARAGQARAGLMENLNKYNKPVAEYGERMVQYKSKDGKYLVNPLRDEAELFTLVKSELSHQGDEIGLALKGIDHSPDIDAVYKDVTEYLNSRIKIAKDGGNTDLIEKLIDQKDRLYNKLFKIVPKGKDVMEEVPVHKTLHSLHQYKRSLYDEMNGESITDFQKTAINHFQRRLGKSISDIAEDVASPEQLTAFKKANTAWGDLDTTKEVLEDVLKGEGKRSPVDKLFNSFFSRNSVIGAGIAFATGVSPQVAIGGALALKQIMETKTVSGTMAHAILRISKAFRKNPDRWEVRARSLVAASAIGSSPFNEELERIDAEVSLAENPLIRSSKEVIKRRGTILSMVKQISETKAEELRNAINHRDFASIQKIMGSIAHLDRNNLMQRGIGFDGMAITERDVHQVNTWISKIKSPRKRKNLATAFHDQSSPSHMVVPEDLINGDSGEEPSKHWKFEKTRKGPSNSPY